MKQKYLMSNITGLLLVSISGVLMHFVYHWSGNNWLVGLFAPVNESTWEHMKLIFFPMLFYEFLEPLIFPDLPSEKAMTSISLLAGTGLIPILFYTYRGVLGFGLAPLDISTFFLSVLAAFLIRYKSSCKPLCQSCYALILFAVLLLLTAFFIFTYRPPDLGIFASPQQAAMSVPILFPYSEW